MHCWCFSVLPRTSAQIMLSPRKICRRNNFFNYDISLKLLIGCIQNVSFSVSYIRHKTRKVKLKLNLTGFLTRVWGLDWTTSFYWKPRLRPNTYCSSYLGKINHVKKLIKFLDIFNEKYLSSSFLVLKTVFSWKFNLELSFLFDLLCFVLIFTFVFNGKLKCWFLLNCVKVNFD